MARTKLTNKEFNLVSTLTSRIKIDEVLDIMSGDADNDYFFDYKSDMELSLSDGFVELKDAIAYPFEHEGFTKEECEILENLFKEFAS